MVIICHDNHNTTLEKSNNLTNKQKTTVTKLVFQTWAFKAKTKSVLYEYGVSIVTC